MEQLHDVQCGASRALLLRGAYSPCISSYTLLLQDGSEYWLLAASLKKIFEEKYNKAIREDGA